MSSTNRGGKRTEADFYVTPAWCIHRLEEVLEFPGGRWLEPCAGDGAIIRAFSHRNDIDWTAVELRSTMEGTLRDCERVSEVLIGDYMKMKTLPLYDVVITNPPFYCAQEVIIKSFGLGAHVFMLLRLNFLATINRAIFMRKYPPNVYVLPNRPSFVRNGLTDSIEYAWFHWEPRYPKKRGELAVLDLTPNSIRKSHRKKD